MFLLEQRNGYVWEAFDRAANYQTAAYMAKRVANETGKPVRIYDPKYFNTFTIEPTESKVG